MLKCQPEVFARDENQRLLLRGDSLQNLPMFVIHHKNLSVLSATIGLISAVSLGAEMPAENIRIQLDTRSVVSRISPDFIGFGYETSAVAQTNYFGPDNATLIQLYRNLGRRGLIRIGGNISDHTRFITDGVAAVHPEEQVSIINQASLSNLAGFVRATGWKVMWGLNLGTGSKEAAVQESLAVQQALGDRLQSFEIGNEVDLRSRYDGKFHDYAGYYSNYLAYKMAIRAALPRAVFSGPDVAVNLSWFTNFAASEAADLKLLTHHYYRTGADNPAATLENLLARDESWDRRLERLQRNSRDHGVGYRINEVNSFSGGGKPGVSDTFAAALWALDYMFDLATHGCSGINLETDINQHAWFSHYSPIIHNATGRCRARPLYYGMLAFSLAGHGDLLKLELTKGGEGAFNLSAYATRNDQGFPWITVVNKELSRAAVVEVATPEMFSQASAFWLKAPSVRSKDQVTFAGADVSPDGNWTPGTPEILAIKDHAVRLLVPPASAVLLRLQP